MPPSSLTHASVYTSSYRGGASWFVLEMAAGMSAAGGDILLIAPEADPPEREALVSGTRRLRLPRGAYGQGSKAARVMRTAARIGATFVAFARARGHARTYVVSFYDWLAVLVLQQLWIRLLGGHLVYVVHDAKPHAWASSPALRWLEVALLRLSYRIPQQVVTLTEVARAQVAGEFGRSGPIAVIPHGSYVKGDNSALPGTRRILAFGTLRRNKRILETIEGVRLATARGAAVHLTIAGVPHKEDAGYWAECATRLTGVEATISTEIGFVTEERLDQLIAESDAMILPYEDFNSQSGVAVMAACSGRLLIATDAGGLGELRDQGVEPMTIERPVTAETIAAAITEFAGMPVDTLRGRAERGKRALDAHLSWTRIGGAYLALCR